MKRPKLFAGRIELSAFLLGCLAVLYPIAAVTAVHTIGPLVVIACLCILLVLRGFLGVARKAPLALTLSMLGVAGAMGVAAAFDRPLSVRLYPAFMNLALLIAFGLSLLRGPSMIERLARLHEPDLPQSGVRYTRRVTYVWVGFFALNGTIAAWTALYADWRGWTLYNGLIAYGAMAALFGVEFAVRRVVRKRAGA